MLEYKVHELDNDFITCWCKYLLAGYNESTINELEKIAEKGQINAIQNWYLFKDKGDNKTIDLVLDSLSDISYNDILAKIRCHGTDDKTIDRLHEIYQYIDEPNPYMGSTGLTDRAKKARNEFANTKIIRLYLGAINESAAIAKRTDNYVLFEIANEMLQEFTADLLSENIQYYIDACYKISCNNTAIIKGITNSLRQENKKIKIKELVDKNPALAFTFVKAILLFNNNHKYKKDAIVMLKQLASREYIIINDQVRK